MEESLLAYVLSQNLLVDFDQLTSELTSSILAESFDALSLDLPREDPTTGSDPFLQLSLSWRPPPPLRLDRLTISAAQTKFNKAFSPKLFSSSSRDRELLLQCQSGAWA
jgi:hypothetical protein